MSKKTYQSKMFKQKNAKKVISDTKKKQNLVDILKNKPVTREEFRKVQNSLSLRIDSILMGMSALQKLLVKAKIIKYEDFRVTEAEMIDILTFVRESMIEFYSKADKESDITDVNEYAYNKAVEAGKDKQVLEHIFNLKPKSTEEKKSLIIKPNEVKIIK